MALLFPGAAQAADEEYRGRPLIEVLEELQDRGLNLIYSSAVVPDDLMVTVEPAARSPRALLAEILPPLGLEARRGPGRAILIVAMPLPLAPGKLAGRVLSAGRGDPVIGGTVAIPQANLEVATRPDGTFKIAGLPAGTYTVRVKAPWFLETIVENVEILPSRTRKLAITLQGQPGYVEEVIVTPGRFSLVQEEQGAGLALSRDDAVLVPTIGDDVSRIIEGLPGVASPGSSAAFSVRGSRTRDVSLVLDGLELYQPFHLESFQSPFSFIDNDIVDKIDFLRGGFTADAGDRHGGFVRLSTRTPDESFRTRLETGTVKSRISHTAPVGKGALLVSARAWYPEAFGAIKLGEDELDARFQDLYFKYSAHVSPRTILSGHALAARDRFDFVEADGAEEVDAANNSGYVWLRALRSWSPSLFSDTVLSGGRLERSREGISEPEDEQLVVDDDRTVRFWGLKHDQSWEISGQHLLKAGFEVRSLDAEYRYTFGVPGSATTTRLAPSGTSFSLHAAHRVALSPSFATEVGLRWDQQDHADDSQFSPRINAVWRLGQRSELRFGWGHFYQSQRIYELRIEDGETDFLPAELSRQSEVTFQHRFHNGLGLRLDTYYRRLSRIQPYPENLFNPVELFPETEADRIIVAPERARFRGAEILLRGALDHPLAWWVSYAWSRAEDVIGGVDVPRSWDQTSAGSFLLAYRWGRQWSASLSGTAHTGWPSTPVFGEAVTQPDGSIELEPVLGARNSARFDTYARLDLKLGRVVSLPDSRLVFELQVTNLTDRNNECCIDDIPLALLPDGSVGSFPEINYWPGFTTSFSVAWEF